MHRPKNLICYYQVNLVTEFLTKYIQILWLKFQNNLFLKFFSVFIHSSLLSISLKIDECPVKRFQYKQKREKTFINQQKCLKSSIKLFLPPLVINLKWKQFFYLDQHHIKKYAIIESSNLITTVSLFFF